MDFNKILKFVPLSKYIQIVVFSLFIGVSLSSCDNDGKLEGAYVPKDVPKTEDLLKSYSYILGFNLSRASTKVDTLRLDYDYFIAGFEAGYKNTPSLYDWKEIQKIQDDYRNLQVQRSISMEQGKKSLFDSLSSSYIDNNPKFLAENKTKEGVKELEGGVQYKFIKENKGAPKPNPTDVVTINFVASLIDGTEFDNTYTRGIPLKADLDKLVPGWKDAISIMGKGDKIKAWIPPTRAFGLEGVSGMVPGNAIIIMEIELEDFSDPAMIQQQQQPMQVGPGAPMPPQGGNR